MIAVPTLIGEVSIRLFVRHGDQQKALDFYDNVFGAKVVGRPYLHNGELIAAELRMGASVVMIVGANPMRMRRLADHGPFMLLAPLQSCSISMWTMLIG